MKRLLITFLMLFTAYLSSDAQTFVTIGTGNEVPTYTLYSPIYRFSATSSTRNNRSNILFTAAELATAGLPSGAVITGISFDKNGTGATNTPSNLTVRMYAANSSSTPPLSTSTTWNDILASHTSVLTDQAFVIPGTAGWVQFPFATNFTYTGGSLEIAIESEISGGSPYGTDKWDWKYTNGYADYIVAGISSSTSFSSTLSSTTSTYKHRPNVQIHYIVPQGLDLTVVSLLSPSAPVSSGSLVPVSVDLGNAATTTITSASVTYQVNNNTPVTETFNGNILQAGSTSFTFSTPMTVPTSTFDLKVWVSNINGQGPDNNSGNDTLVASICPALAAGTYTLGGATPDYSSIAAFVDRVNCGGIAGPVTLSIQPGTYPMTATLNNVPGAAAGSSITFSSATSVASDVILEVDTPANAGGLYVEGTDGVTFANLTFRRNAIPSTTSFLLSFSGGSDNGSVVNCNFVDSTGTSTSSLNRAILISQSGGVAVQNNVFNGFYYGVELEALASNNALQNIVASNQFYDYKYRAMLVGEQLGIQIVGNRFVNFGGTSTAGAAIYMSANRSFVVQDNDISGGISGYGIYSTNNNGDSTAYCQFINNSIVGTTASGITSATIVHYGMYLISSTTDGNDFVEVLNNTVNLNITTTSTSTLQSGVYFSGGSAATPAWDGVRFINNNIAVFPTPGNTLPPNYRALRFSIPTAADIGDFNHNNYYLGGGTNNLIRINSPLNDFATLQDWRDTTGNDLNGLNVDPVFATTNSGIPTAAGLDNAGMPLAAVATDITGATRDLLTPDIGAYEFSPNTRDLAVVSLLNPVFSCGLGASEPVTVVLENIGLNAISTADLTLIFNGGTPQVNALNRTINPADTIHFTFTNTVNMATGGNYTFEIYVTTANDGNPLNDTLRTDVLNPLLNNFPYLIDFEAASVGVATGLPDGWTINPVTGFRFQVEDGTTSSTNTGPTVDHTLGTAAGKYIYSEASSGSAGDVAQLISPCLNLSSLTAPAVQFWYHMYGADIDRLVIEAEVGGNWVPVDSIVGEQQTANADPWLMYRTLIPTNAAAIRFSVVRGTSFDGDVALDDIRILESPTTDIRVTRLVSPLQGCALTNSEPITAEFINVGIDTLNNSPVGYRINGGSVSVGALSNFLPGDTLVYTFPVNADLSTLGANYTIEIFNSNTNDGFTSNDTAVGVAHNYPVVNSFPYNQDFEANDGGWYASGSNSSWAYGTPAGSVIDTAASGTKAWVTNLTGLYNASETSYLQSPCFDFSSLVDPDVEFDIWWNTNGTAGVTNLAYSTDGGATWSPVGNTTSGISNWFNYAGNATSLTQPGWQGNPGSGGWVRAKHNVGFLAGEPNVSFRVQFFSSTSTIQRDGVGIDNFSVSQRTSPIFVEVDEMGDSCSVTPRTVTAEIVHAFPLTSVDLNYDLGTGTFVNAPMTFAAGRWSGNIPAGTPNTLVTYRVVATDSAGQTDTSEALTYTDDYLVINAGNDTTIMMGDTATLTAMFNTSAPLLITEVDLGGTDALEIQNVSNATIDVTGWKVVVRDSYTDINSVNSIVQTLSGTLTPGQTITYSDGSTSPDYWGNNLFWNPGAFPSFTGWVMILDPSNEVVDAVFWSWPESNIQAAAISVGGNPINLTGAWMGDGLNTSTVPAGITISRIGNVDNNDSTGFGFINASIGTTNPGLQLPFNGSGVNWTTLNGTLIDTTSVIRVSPSVTTSYVATISDGICTKSDTVVVNVNQPLPDVGVSAFVNPTSTTPINGTPIQVTVIVNNYGPVDVSGFDVAFAVDGGTSISTNTISTNITAGDSIQHTFTLSWTPTTSGALELCAFTTGAQNEVNFSNDTSCITLNSTVSVEDLAKSNALISKVYPNPASTEVFFELKSAQVGSRLEVYDNIGRLVHTQDIDQANQTVRITTENWATGLYSYSLITPSEVQYGKLIIKR